MKISWTSLKISIAGAKLSHLVQKDRIWDHGSMAEQARIIFYLVLKAKASGNIEPLKKQCSIPCFEKLKLEISRNKTRKTLELENTSIKEIAIIDVHPRKNNRPDSFIALIKGVSKNDESAQFKSECVFIRQGDWWVLEHEKLDCLI